MTRISRNLYMGFFRMVILNVSTFNFFHILVVMCCSSLIPQFRHFVYRCFFSLFFCFIVFGIKKKVYYCASQRFVVVDEQEGVMVDCCEQKACDRERENILLWLWLSLKNVRFLIKHALLLMRLLLQQTSYLQNVTQLMLYRQAYIESHVG